MYKKYGKRIFDVIVSFILILLCMPIYLLISIFVLFDVGWPIIFRQERLGKGVQLFGIWKFKSLKGDIVHNSFWKPSDETQRASCFGRFIRSHCIDEIPQFINVLIGDMSLVGPRPIQEVNFSDQDKSMYEQSNVLPGLTGINQVIENKLEFSSYTEAHYKNNLRYIKDLNFWGDIQIIFKTILVIYKGR